MGLARGVCRGECKGVPPEERGEPGGPGRGVERALGGGGCSPAPPPLGPREGSVCVLEVGEPPALASSPVGSGEKEKTGLLGLLRGLDDRPVEAPLTLRDLWLCWAISRARRVGTGEPPPPASVMLRTSMDFRSGRRFP